MEHNIYYNKIKKFSVDNILGKLRTKFIGKKIVYVSSVDSTNNLAKRIAPKGSYPDGTMIIADNQTLGRGRLGSKWFSEINSSLTVSLLLYPKINIDKLFCVPVAAGLAVYDAIFNISGIATQLKWPNDVLINFKKICGILCETSFVCGRNCLIIGIGANIDTVEFPRELVGKCSSVFKESGIHLERELLSAEFCNCFEKYYEYILNEEYKEIIDKYKKLCVSLKKEVKIEFNGKNILGIAEDISYNGELILACMDGKKLTIGSSYRSYQKLE